MMDRQKPDHLLSREPNSSQSIHGARATAPQQTSNSPICLSMAETHFGQAHNLMTLIPHAHIDFSGASVTPEI
jgi:hypothetical protein